MFRLNALESSPYSARLVPCMAPSFEISVHITV